MAKAFQSSPFKIRRVRLSRRQPEIEIAELALMLELDLAFGRRDDFRRRLQKALNDAGRQGHKASRSESHANR